MTKKSAKTRPSGKNHKFTTLLNRFSKPLLAALIIVSLAAVGYYASVNSNANSFNSQPPKVDCQNPKSDRCQQRQQESDAKFYAQLEKDCEAAGRKYANKACGDCRAAFQEVNNKCKERETVNCLAQGRKQDGKFDCSGCLDGYSLNKAKVCVEDKQPVVAAPVTDQCPTGQTLTAGRCIVPQVKNICETQGKTFNSRTNTCPTDNCRNNQTLVAGRCIVPTVKSVCEQQHKIYNEKNNTCREKCVEGYYMNGSTCYPIAKPVENATVKASCDAVFKVYDVATNTCLNTCLEGYYLENKACVKIPNKVADCNRSVTGRCTAAVEAVKAVCAGQKLEYNEKLNSCRNSCVDGYYKSEGVCKKVGEGDAKKIQAACDALNLTYNAAGNICKPNCKAGYTMRSGACVKWEEASMTKWRCNALGRVWMPAVAATAETEAQAGFCQPTCKDIENTTYVDLGDPDNSYCKAKKSADGIDGVSTKMTKEQCQKENRAWIEALNACAARCKTGYYFSDKNKCVVLVAATNPNEQGTGEEGDGETGGCQYDLQNHTVTLATKRPLWTMICPDDLPGTDPVEDDKSVKHQVETTLTKEACSLLGRVWVPDAKVDGKKVKGGCSLQECKIKGADVRQSNGSAYCEGNIIRISKERCQALHRVWSPIVNGCLTNPNQSRTNPTVDSKQCKAPYTVYVYHTAAQGFDECVKPSSYQLFKTVAKKSGRSVAYVASLPAAGVCKLRPNMTWSDGKCVKRRVPVQSNNTTTSGSSDNLSTGQPTGTGSVNCGVMGVVKGSLCPVLNQAGCTAKHRAWVNGVCQARCAAGWTGYTVASPYNYCTKRADSTTTTTSCPGNMIEVNGDCYGHGGSPTTTYTTKTVSCDELRKIMFDTGRTYGCPFYYLADWGCDLEVTASDDKLTWRTFYYGATKYRAKTC